MQHFTMVLIIILINQVAIYMIVIVIDRDLTTRTILRNLIFNRRNSNDIRSIDRWNILLKRIIRMGIRKE